MRYIFSLFLLLSVGANAQWKSYQLSAKGDTLNRVDQKGLKQGAWVVQVPGVRGERGYEEEGYYRDDKKDGTWRQYSLEGDQLAIENYRWGQKDGRSQYFNYVGDLVREESWRAIDPKNPYDSVKVVDPKDPTIILHYQLVKIENGSVKHGTWRFYDPGTGRIEATEQWVMDRKKTKEDDDEELALIDPVTGSAKKEAVKPKQKPKEVLEFEKKNAGKKKIKVRDGNTGG